MKGKLTSFLAGMATALLVGVLSVSALAAGGSRSITVTPIEVLVDGQVFRPEEGLVFAYQGVTYAPLRALAEAYGLEVGYDGEKHLATVSRSSVGDFAAQWTVHEKPVTNYGSEQVFTAEYTGRLSAEAFQVWWRAQGPEALRASAEAMAAELQRRDPGCQVTLYFSFGSNQLGTAIAMDTCCLSSFDAADVWIK